MTRRPVTITNPKPVPLDVCPACGSRALGVICYGAGRANVARVTCGACDLEGPEAVEIRRGVLPIAEATRLFQLEQAALAARSD